MPDIFGKCFLLSGIDYLSSGLKLGFFIGGVFFLPFAALKR